MLDYHKEHHADATIAVIEVPMKEASRFGIMNTEEGGKIVEFEEKPAEPKSNLASMGIYIFNWPTLKEALLTLKDQPGCDFGMHVIPYVHEKTHKCYAYEFNGYWKDVGTIESLWEANMDLLQLPMPIDLYDKKWRIYGRNPGMAPHFIADGASVSAYAVDAMSWCVEHDIITGTTATTLEPQGTATRAQAAAMLMRFAENLK